MSSASQNNITRNGSWYIWGYLLIGSLGAGFILWEIVLPILQHIKPIAIFHNQVILPFVLRAIYAQVSFTIIFVILSAAALFLWPHLLITRMLAVIMTICFSYWIFHCRMWHYAYIPSMFIAVFILYAVMRYLWVFLFHVSILRIAIVAIAVAIVAFHLSGSFYWCAAACIPFAVLPIRAGSYYAIRQLVQSNNARGVQFYYDAKRYFCIPPIAIKENGLIRFWNRSPEIQLKRPSLWESLLVPFARKYRRRCNNGTAIGSIFLVPAKLFVWKSAPTRLQCSWLEKLLEANESAAWASFFNKPSRSHDHPDSLFECMIRSSENYWEYQYFTPASLRNNRAALCQLALKYDRLSRIGLAMKTRLINIGQDRPTRLKLGRLLDIKQQYLLKRAATLLEATVHLPVSDEVIAKEIIEKYLAISAIGDEPSENLPEKYRSTFRELDALGMSNDSISNEILQACYWRILSLGLDTGHMESILTALRELSNRYDESWSKKDRFVFNFIFGHICYRQRAGIQHVPNLKTDLAGRSGTMFDQSDTSEISTIILPEMPLLNENIGENNA